MPFFRNYIPADISCYRSAKTKRKHFFPSCIFCAPSVGWVLPYDISFSLLVGLAILSGRIDGIRILVSLGKTKACVTCHIFAILSLMLCFSQRVFQNGREPKSLFASGACLRGKSRICRHKSRNHNSGRHWIGGERGGKGGGQ